MKAQKHAKTAIKQERGKNPMGGVYWSRPTLSTLYTQKSTQQSLRRSLRTFIVLELKERNVKPTPCSVFQDERTHSQRHTQSQETCNAERDSKKQSEANL